MEINSYEDFKKLSFYKLDRYINTPGRTREQSKQLLTWIRMAEAENYQPPKEDFEILNEDKKEEKRDNE